MMNSISESLDGSITQSIKDEFNGQLQDIFSNEEMKQLMDQAGLDANDFLANMNMDVSTGLDNINHTVDTKTGSLFDRYTNLMNGKGTEIETTTKDIFTRTSAHIVDGINAGSNAAETSLNEGLNRIKGTAQEGIGLLIPEFENSVSRRIKQAAEKTTNDTTETVRTGIAAGGRNIQREQEQVILGVLAEVSGFTDQFNRKASDFSGQLDRHGKDIIRYIATTARDAKTESEHSAELVLAGVKKELEKLPDETKRAGEDAGEGFADGMGSNSVSQKIRDRASGLARTALDSMKRTLDEHSPSKETRKIGVNGGLGFGMGLTDAFSYVKSKATMLAESSVTAMQSAMEILQDTLNFDPDMQPVISPVMNLAGIQNGVAAIHSLLDDPQYAVAGIGGIDPYAVAAMRRVTTDADNSAPDNDNVVQALGSVKDEVSTLKGAMESMEFTADGKNIGKITYKEVNRNLGNTITRERREGK
jgi:hypothetical protein